MRDIVDLCEPVFVYVCYINRCGRLGDSIEYDEVRTNIDQLLREIENNLKIGTNLRRQYARIKLPLLFFIDSMICQSGVDFNKKWDADRLSYEVGEMTGDQSFFQLLEVQLDDFSVDSESCLIFFYLCLELGFTGVHKSDPDKINFYLDRIVEKVPSLNEKVDLALFKDIKKNVDTRSLLAYNWLSTKKLVLIIAVFCILYILFNVSLYYGATHPLFIVLNKMIDITF